MSGVSEAAVEAAYMELPYDAVPFVDIDTMHIIIEAAAPYIRAQILAERIGEVAQLFSAGNPSDSEGGAAA